MPWSKCILSANVPILSLQRFPVMKLSKLALALAISCVGATAGAQTTAPTTKPAAAANQSSAAKTTADSQPLTAQQEKWVASMKKQTMKAYENASLTAEQEKKADEIFSKAIKDAVVKRSAAKITPEMQRKQAAAVKEARDSGKKGKEQAAAAFDSAGFNEVQIKVFKETQETLTTAKREFAKTLKEEQIKKLPENMQTMLKRSK